MTQNDPSYKQKQWLDSLSSLPTGLVQVYVTQVKAFVVLLPNTQPSSVPTFSSPHPSLCRTTSYFESCHCLKSRHVGKPNVTCHTRAERREQLPCSFLLVSLSWDTGSDIGCLRNAEKAPHSNTSFHWGLKFSTNLLFCLWNWHFTYYISKNTYQEPENIHNLELGWEQLRILLSIKMNNVQSSNYMEIFLTTSNTSPQ